MGKDHKNIQRGETFSRINFLYQAAHAALVANPRNLELARTYVHSLKAIAGKAVLRLDPTIKRSLCKRCYMILIPGITSSIRIRSRREKHMVVRCLDCNTIKRFPLNPEYKLWTEQPQAWHNATPKHTLTGTGAETDAATKGGVDVETIGGTDAETKGGTNAEIKGGTNAETNLEKVAEAGKSTVINSGTNSRLCVANKRKTELCSNMRAKTDVDMKTGTFVMTNVGTGPGTDPGTDSGKNPVLICDNHNTHNAETNAEIGEYKPDKIFSTMNTKATYDKSIIIMVENEENKLSLSENVSNSSSIGKDPGK